MWSFTVIIAFLLSYAASFSTTSLHLVNIYSNFCFKKNVTFGYSEGFKLHNAQSTLQSCYCKYTEIIFSSIKKSSEHVCVYIYTHIYEFSNCRNITCTCKVEKDWSRLLNCCPCMFCSTAEYAIKPIQAYQATRFDETYWTQNFHNGTAQIYLAQASLTIELWITVRSLL